MGLRRVLPLSGWVLRVGNTKVAAQSLSSTKKKDGAGKVNNLCRTSSTKGFQS